MYDFDVLQLQKMSVVSASSFSFYISRNVLKSVRVVLHIAHLIKMPQQYTWHNFGNTLL